MLTADEVKARVNLVQEIQRTVPLKKVGLTWQGKCPFHLDSNPSLDVSDAKQLWTCHSCNIGGSVIDWVMRRDNVDFAEAARRLREQLGDIPAPKQAPPLPSLDRSMAEGFHRSLTPQKREYYHQRGLTDATIDKWQLGYNGEAFTIPVFDAQGELRQIKYRRDDGLPQSSGKPKYWSVTGHGTHMFNAKALKREPDAPGLAVWVCEGEFDCIMLEQAGFHAVTSTGGCERFDPDWVSLFGDCDTVYLCLDNDEPGKKAATKLAALLGPKVIPVPLPDGVKDVTEYFLAGHTSDELSELTFSLSEKREQQQRLRKGGLLSELGLDGFLADYMAYGAEVCDAPHEFHLAVGLSLVSAAVGNRVALRLWAQERRLNLWVVLIAPSGFYRKSQAANLGLNLLRQLDTPCLLPSNFTQEKLVQILATQPFGLIPADEFAELLGSLERDYNQGTKQMLTNLYEAPSYSRDTIGQGTQKIDKPSLSMLATSTIDWLQARVREGDVRGGFLSRFMFFPARVKPHWMGLEDYFDQEHHDRLLGHLNKLAKMSGIVNIGAVKPILNAWLEKFETNVNAGKTPPELIGFMSRSGIFVAKLAALCELSSSGSLTVTRRSAEQAIILVEYLNTQLAHILSGEELVFSRSGRDRKKVRELLARSPIPMSRSDVLYQSHLSKRDFDAALETMLATGEVTEKTVKPEGRGRPGQLLTLARKEGEDNPI